MPAAPAQYPGTGRGGIGAFASFLHRGGDRGAGILLEDVGRYSNDQILELARFVEQVSPEALQQLGSLISANPVETAAFGVSAALLLRLLRRTPVPEAPPAAHG